jgi:L-alanine-DL-glutamate epimerase-like enolase superfamily enzyme
VHDLDSSSETVVVRLTDEEGRQGIGEADAAAAAVAGLVLMEDIHAWSRGLAAMLTGRDPFPIRALHAELYASTIWHGRRGLGIHALSAVDVALHDLVGKQLARPVVDLLGGRVRERALPYATIYQGAVAGRTRSELMDVTAMLFERALGLGVQAVKMEVIWGDLVTDRQLVECIREGRKLLGDDVTLLVDFGYRWSDWRDALWVLSRLENADLFLAEAPLRHDDLPGTGSSPVGSRRESAAPRWPPPCTSAASGSAGAVSTRSSPTSVAAAGSRSCAGSRRWPSSRACS